MTFDTLCELVQGGGSEPPSAGKPPSGAGKAPGAGVASEKAWNLGSASKAPRSATGSARSLRVRNSGLPHALTAQILLSLNLRCES